MIMSRRTWVRINGRSAPPLAPTVDAGLPVVDASTPGVYGDGSQYTAGITQACPDRAVFLVGPAGMPAGLPLPAVCDESGRVQVHLPGNPADVDGDYGNPGPSFDIKGGKVHATGWMRPTLNLFWDCKEGSEVDSSFCNFVWTDGKSFTTGDVTSITGHCATLYVGYTGVRFRLLQLLWETPQPQRAMRSTRAATPFRGSPSSSSSSSRWFGDAVAGSTNSGRAR